MQVRWRTFAALVGAVLIFGSTQVWRVLPARAAGSDSFVAAHGTDLLLDGEPYRFTGANIYNANSDGWCGYQYSDNQLAAAFDALAAGAPGAVARPEGAAVRPWFFQSLAAAKANGVTHRWSGARDWTRFDRTLADARRRGFASS